MVCERDQPFEIITILCRVLAGLQRAYRGAAINIEAVRAAFLTMVGSQVITGYSQLDTISLE